MTMYTEEELLKRLGDPRSVHDGLKRHGAAAARFNKEREKLLGEYPNLWVAVSSDGLMAWGRSAEEVLQQVESHGLASTDIALRYLNPNQMQYIL